VGNRVGKKNATEKVRYIVIPVHDLESPAELDDI
jgi:hypothetical protein